MVEEVHTTGDIVPWNIADNPVFEPSSFGGETSPTSTNSTLWEERMEEEGGRVDILENNEP